MTLPQQLEDKKKGCGTYLYDSDFEDLQDLFEHRVDCGVQEVITGEMQYCKTCKAEIAILEQALAEINDLCNKLFEKDLLLQKQRQEILDKIDLYLMVTKGNYECQKALKELKQQLNQPKEEDGE
jgi:hypothetical protein